jgi:hypothetical protein
VKPTPKIRFFVNFAIIFCFIVSNSAVFAGEIGGTQQEQGSCIKTSEVPDKLEIKSFSNQENRQRYSYRYYPSCSVYYDVDRSLYYYLEDDDWKISASLPSNLEEKLDDYVKIEMDNDKPYIDHKKHVQNFPPKEPRRIKSNFWSKLVFVLLFEHPPR